jgi:hypothetical protein
VLRGTDGGVVAWKPGDNCTVRVPVKLHEQRAVAQGVLVRDAWDGSVQDIELEVSGLPRTFSEEEEHAAVQSAVRVHTAQGFCCCLVVKYLSYSSAARAHAAAGFCSHDLAHALLWHTVGSGRMLCSNECAARYLKELRGLAIGIN